VFGTQEGIQLSASFDYSKDWLEGCKKRHWMRSYVKHGEAADASIEGVRLAQENVRKVLLDGGFSKKETYKQDESGFFWRQLPTCPHWLGKKAGWKKISQRVTVLVFRLQRKRPWKRQLHMIGKVARPCTFPWSFQPKRDPGLQYFNNKTGWRTSAEFSGWAKDRNSDLGQCVAHLICMHSHLRIWRGRVQRLVISRVLLAFAIDLQLKQLSWPVNSLCWCWRTAACMLDNAPTHMMTDCEVMEFTAWNSSALVELDLQLIFLPAHVPSPAQPLDQGSIACVKAHYRRRLIKWILDAANAPGNERKILKERAPTFYQMRRWVHVAWMQDLLQIAIAKCWRHAGILPDAWVQPLTQDGAAVHVRDSSSTEDDSVPTASNGAEHADQMGGRLGRARAQLQAALDDLSSVANKSVMVAKFTALPHASNKYAKIAQILAVELCLQFRLI
jgi:hypothetical protein